MDKPLIYDKIESLRRCIARVESRRPEQLDILLTDLDSQDILSLNLTRAVQLCVDIAMHVIASTNQPIPETMAESFDRLHDLRILSSDLAERLKRAVGFRNVAIHNYRSWIGRSCISSATSASTTSGNSRPPSPIIWTAIEPF